jgi:uncharacterized membrane protein YqjE
MSVDPSHNGLREQPIGELFKQLSADLSTLVRQEIRLAQVEMTEKGKRAGLGAGLMGGGGLIGLLALGSLTACLIAALATGMETWLAALIVAVLYGIAAAVLAMSGKNKVAEATPPAPEQTIETVKEDVEWAKTQLSSESR